MNNDDLKQLRKKINNLKLKNNIIPPKTSTRNNKFPKTSIGFAIIIELISSIMAGFVIGSFLDKLFHTSKPYYLVICLILGIIAGLKIILNLYV